MFLLQTHRDTAPLPTAKLTSNPAGWWAWIPGSESQPLDLTKALYFDQTSIYLVFCHLHLYSLSHRWPGHHIAIFNNLALFLFELLFFKVGFASFGRKIESFQFCPYLNLTLCLRTSHWKQGDAQLMTFWMTLYRWRESCSWWHYGGVTLARLWISIWHERARTLKHKTGSSDLGLFVSPQYPASFIYCAMPPEF